MGGGQGWLGGSPPPPGYGPRRSWPVSVCVCELCACVRCGRGDSSSAPEKHAGFCLKSRVCGYSAVSHLGISPVQLLLPSLETVFPGWVFVTQFPHSLFPPEYNSPVLQLHSQFVGPPSPPLPPGRPCACAFHLFKALAGPCLAWRVRHVYTCSASRCQGRDDCRRCFPAGLLVELESRR